MDKDSIIFFIGDKSPEGIGLIEYYKNNGYNNIVSESVYNLDLMNQNAVSDFFKNVKPEYVFFCHVLSGGISANIKYAADFIYKNLQIQNNIIHYSYKNRVKKLLFIGSSCIYPKECPQPIKEEYLFTGKMEKTSEPYSVAKIAGIEMCQAYNQQYNTNFISAVPATVYGPEEDLDIENSHVIVALIGKFHIAKKNNEKSITIWGSGKARREFIYVDDIVDACLFLMNNYNSSDIINIGYGEDISIKDLAIMIKDIINYKGDIIFDKIKPEGVLKKLLDNKKITDLGWHPKVTLEEGIARFYKWYIQHYNN